MIMLATPPLTVGQIECHDSIMWLEKGSVDLEVCRAAGEGLHIDTPLRGVKAEGLECALLQARVHEEKYKFV